MFLPVIAQNDPARFGHISVEQGLSQATVFSIVQDNRGFMWFATYDGINKYDGYTFKTYRRIENDSSSLSNNGVSYLYEDKKGFIWVINNANEGLCKFNPKTEKFTRYYHNPDDPTSISSDIISHVMQEIREIFGFVQIIPLIYLLRKKQEIK